MKSNKEAVKTDIREGCKTTQICWSYPPTSCGVVVLSLFLFHVSKVSCVHVFFYSFFSRLPDVSERSQSSKCKTNLRKQKSKWTSFVFQFHNVAHVCVNPWPWPEIKGPVYQQ